MAVVAEAFVKIRPDLSGFSTELKREIKRAVREAGPDIRAAGDDFGRQLGDRLGRGMSDGIRRGIGNGLSEGIRDSLDNASNEASERGREAGERYRRGFNSGRGDLNGNGSGNNSNNNSNRNTVRGGNDSRDSLLGATLAAQRFGQALTRIGAINALAVVAGQAVVLAASLAPVLSIVNAIPSALAITGSSFAVLKIGFSGIGDALKATGATAGAVANNTVSQQRAVEQAVKGVTRAQRELVEARKGVADAEYEVGRALRAVDDAGIRARESIQSAVDAEARIRTSTEALTRARRDATRALADYQSRLKGAALSEEAANIALLKAQKEYQALIADGVEDDLKLRDARLQLAEAELRQQDALQSRVDLEEQYADAQKKGINGADAVVSANQELSDAYRDAQRAMRDNEDAILGIQEANRGVAKAQDDVAAANQRVIDAQDEIVEANQRVADAQLALAQAAAGGAAAIDKAAEAMAKLSPNAQKLVRDINSLKPAFGDLRKGIQDSLLENVGTDLKALALETLPVLRTGLGNVAGAFNSLLLRMLAVARTPVFQENLGVIFDATRIFVEQLADALPPLLGGLVNLAAVAAPVVLRFTEFVTEGLKAAGVFMQTKEGAQQLTDKASKAGDRLSTLWQILKNVASIVSTVFASSGADEFIKNIETLTKRFSEFLKTPEGQEDLRTLFEGLKNASSAIADVIGTVADGVIAIIGAINSLPEPVRNFIYQFFAWTLVLGPVISTVAGLVVGIGALAGAIATIGVPIAIVVAAFAGFVAVVVTGVLVIIKYWDAIKFAAQELKNNVVEAFDRIRSGIEERLNGAVTFVEELPTKIKNAFTGGTTLLYGYGGELLRGLLDGMTNGLSELALFAFNQLPDSVTKPFKEALGIASPSKVFLQFGVDIIQGLLNGLTETGRLIFGVIAGIGQTLYGGFLGIVNTVSTTFQSIGSGAASAVSSALSFFGSLPSRILGALGNLGQLLFGEGQNIIIGLINGMITKLNDLVSTVSTVATRAKDTFRRIMDIQSPSRVFAGYGKNIIEGLALGMTDNLGLVTSAMGLLQSNLQLDTSTVARASGLTDGGPGYASRGDSYGDVNVTNYITPSSPTSWEDETRKAYRLRPPRRS